MSLGTGNGTGPITGTRNMTAWSMQPGKGTGTGTAGGRSINALDYLIQIRGYGLVDAVHTLVGGEIQQAPAYRRCNRKSPCAERTGEGNLFFSSWVGRCATSAVSYLQRRGISSDVIGRCSGKGLFYKGTVSWRAGLCVCGKG